MHLCLYILFPTTDTTKYEKMQKAKSQTQNPNTCQYHQDILSKSQDQNPKWNYIFDE